MENLAEKTAVVTGAGSGIGRALATQLVGHGCHVALCDIHAEDLDHTLGICKDTNPHSVRVSSYVCDVAVEDQVEGFVNDVRSRHNTDQINLLINNAAINGGGSFVTSSREEWERTFNIDWHGVYLMTRHFLPLLMKCNEGHVVNMASANAIRAVLGGHVPHTAYSTAKFAVRGFSESLIHDFRYNAPHLGVSVVMPGHTGTNIISNSARVLSQHQPDAWNDEEIAQHKRRWKIAGATEIEELDDSQVRARGTQEILDMQSLGMPPEEAAQIIIEGVRSNTWRILIGTDTQSMDQLVRTDPDGAYDVDFVERWRKANAMLNSSD